MPEQHQPTPLTSSDPYPPLIDEGLDPMAERRRNSAAHYDAVDAALAGRPKAPTHIARTRAIDHGLEVNVDDGRATAIAITTPTPGRLTITLAADDRALAVEIPLSTATPIIEALRAVAGLTLEHAAPITGSR